jgi:hypothetical protein
VNKKLHNMQLSKSLSKEDNIFQMSNILSKEPNELHLKDILKQMDRTPNTLYSYLQALHKANSQNEKYQKYLFNYKPHNELQEKELDNLYKLTNKDVPYELEQFSKENLSDNFLNNLFYFTFVFKYCK